MKNLTGGRRRFKLSVYMLNVAIPIFFVSTLQGLDRLIGALLLVPFLAAYLISFRHRVLVRSVSIGVQVIIMIMMASLFNVGFFWEIFFPATSIGFLPQRRDVNIGVVTMVVVDLVACTILSHHQPLAFVDWMLVLGAHVAGVSAVYGVRFQNQVSESRESLRQANKRIEQLTRLAERERISRDLHDVMGHELSMITLKAQLATRLIDKDPTSAKQEIEDIQEAAQNALLQVREYIADIRQPLFEREWAGAQELLTLAGIACESHTDDLCDLSEPSLQIAAMCLREAITNIVRHSRADKVFLRFHVHTEALELVIADNGQGFPSKSASKTESGGNGLRGIQSRLKSVNGSMYIWSNGHLVLPFRHSTTKSRAKQITEDAVSKGATPSFDTSIGTLIDVFIPLQGGELSAREDSV